LVRTFSWPTPRRGIGVGDLDELGDGVLAVSDHMGRHPFGDGLHPATDDEAPVVAPDQERLDDAGASTGLTHGDHPGGAHGLSVRQVQTDAAAMVAIQRLDHARVADPVGGRHRGVDAADHLAAGDRAGRPEANSLVVRPLSPAMSTASAPVIEVIVARIRLACTP
jgi:hypothetical protein